MRWWQHCVWSWQSSVIKSDSPIRSGTWWSTSDVKWSLHDVSLWICTGSRVANGVPGCFGMLVKTQNTCGDATKKVKNINENTSTGGLSGSTLCWCIIEKSFCTAECSLFFSHALIAELKVIVVTFLKQIWRWDLKHCGVRRFMTFVENRHLIGFLRLESCNHDSTSFIFTTIPSNSCLTISKRCVVHEKIFTIHICQTLPRVKLGPKQPPFILHLSPACNQNSCAAPRGPQKGKVLLSSALLFHKN